MPADHDDDGHLPEESFFWDGDSTVDGDGDPNPCLLEGDDIGVITGALNLFVWLAVQVRRVDPEVISEADLQAVETVCSKLEGLGDWPPEVIARMFCAVADAYRGRAAPEQIRPWPPGDCDCGGPAH